MRRRLPPSFDGCACAASGHTALPALWPSTRPRPGAISVTILTASRAWAKQCRMGLATAPLVLACVVGR
eukprot:5179113-Lingulodinium_polyedra.AAC.1